MRLTPPKYLVFSLFIIALISFNLYLWQSTFVALILGLLFLILGGWNWGEIIFPLEGRALKIFYGLFFLLSVISSLGALIYFFYRWDNLAISLALIIITLFTFFLLGQRLRNSIGHFESNASTENQAKEKSNLNQRLPNTLIHWFSKNWLWSSLLLGHLLLIFIGFRLLFTHRTSEAIISPWQVLPPVFFIIYFIAALTLSGFLIINKKNWLSLILLSLQAALTFSVALVIYRIGYGFDPFIHQATEKIIFFAGQISPKPLYYLGQYSLVVFLAKLFFLNPDLVDKLLLPSLAAAYLPLTIYYCFDRLFGWRKESTLFLVLIFFLLPFESFIVTTPQGLANLYSLIAISFDLLYLNGKIALTPILILTAADLLIHPLAGLILLAFLGLILIFRYFKKTTGGSEILRKTIISLALILAALILPLSFLVYSYFSPTLGAHLDFTILKNPANITNLISGDRIKKQFNIVYDLIYSFKSYLNLLVLLIALAGFFLARKKRQSKIFSIYLLAFLVTFINYFLLKNFLAFSALIGYEQSNYSERIREISFYFLIPIVLYVAQYFIGRLEKTAAWFRFSWIFFLALFLTVSLYLSYPRADRSDTSRGFSTSASDLKAVQTIDQASQGKDYLVLADQAVSAAAIREFGFKKYYHQNIFYYPLPTGGELYQLYLQMVYSRPTRNIVKQALALTGAQEAYFVVNNYWRHSEGIIEQASITADSFWNIDNGRVFVFKYSR